MGSNRVLSGPLKYESLSLNIAQIPSSGLGDLQDLAPVCSVAVCSFRPVTLAPLTLWPHLSPLALAVPSICHLQGSSPRFPQGRVTSFMSLSKRYRSMGPTHNALPSPDRSYWSIHFLEVL